MEINWTKNAADDLAFWKKNNPKVVQRIAELVESIKEDPFSGIGKPEPLKYNLSGCWSRRINGDNRLVYKIKDANEIVIMQCRYHYR
ncbi:MAG: Txe/YoeB family addiction module toxin [Pseudomonadota bacterium]